MVKLKPLDITLSSMFAALTALGAYLIIPLPFTPVPLTLQTFFTYTSGAVLGKYRGALSQIIYIGKKNTISYVLVAVTILNKSDTCAIQARGRQISKAVDVAEITRRKFLQDMVEVSKVEIGSEELMSDMGGEEQVPKTVSTVEIVLKKKK